MAVDTAQPESGFTHPELIVVADANITLRMEVLDYSIPETQDFPELFRDAHLGRVTTHYLSACSLAKAFDGRQWLPLAPLD